MIGTRSRLTTTIVSVFALHNELPLRHVFLILDGKTKGPDLFSGKQLYSDPSAWSVVEFNKILNLNFRRKLLF